MCKVTMKMEKSTKNTIKFEEVSSGKLTSPAIGTIYVPKSTLKAIGWEEGKHIALEIKVVDEVGEEVKATKAKTTKAKTTKAEKKPA